MIMDYGTYDPATAQDMLTDVVPSQPQTMLPMARRARLLKLQQQAAEMEGAEPDVSQLQEFARMQGQAGQASMLNALAAQYAGEQFQPVQAQFLKRAMAAQEPMKIGGGMLTPDGKFIRDPFAAQERGLSRLDRLIQSEQGAITAEEAAALRREDAAQIQRDRRADAEQRRQDALARQRSEEQYRKDLLELRRELGRKDGSQAGSFSVAGFTPQGQQVVTNTKSGISYVLSLNPDGTPNYAPYQGSMIPKATFEKEVAAAGDLSAVASRADSLVKQIEESPEAFGLRSAAVAAVPGAMQGYAARAVGLTPQQMQARSTVLRQAAQEINELYGAALSMGEQARANTFLPNPSDPPEMLISKLKAARDWANSQLGRFSPAVTGASRARSGNPPEAAPTQPKKRIRFDSQGNEIP
jgi:hypothetical protein